MADMESMWHSEVIDPQVERSLHALQALGVLDRCYLAGGTGLALHVGHCRSHDLDFFSRDAVAPGTLIQRMETLTGFAVASQATDTVHASVHNIKVSFLAYPYPLLFPLAMFCGVNVAHPHDIACMKLSAIAGRGTKRDFVDLYFTVKQCGFAQLLRWFKQKYARVNHSLTHILKSLTWFEDADKEPMPDMLVPLSWEDVKRFFRAEASRLSP